MLKAVAGGAVPVYNTFTPGLSNIGDGTYAVQTGDVAKIGEMVFCDIEIDISAVGTASGNLVVTGLPYTSASTAKSVSSSLWCSNFAVTAGNLSAIVASNSTTISIWKDSGASTNIAQATHADMGSGTLRLSIAYRAAS